MIAGLNGIANGTGIAVGATSMSTPTVESLSMSSSTATDQAATPRSMPTPLMSPVTWPLSTSARYVRTRSTPLVGLSFVMTGCPTGVSQTRSSSSTIAAATTYVTDSSMSTSE
jgi:hypothetical protein